MILIDFSQLAISTATALSLQKPKIDLTDNILRHMVLNTIISLKNRLREYSDEIVLCLDNHSDSYWRKDLFPEYKQHRKKHRDNSDFDWEQFFTLLNKIIPELQAVLPYKMITIPKCEADDIISVLALNSDKAVVIISSDKDFLQLQELNPKIKQYSNHHKKFLNSNDNEYSLFEHIIRGDSGDAIPNILSDDDTHLIEGKKSKIIRTDKIKSWVEFEHTPEYFCENIEMLRKFERNKKLIDLTQVPKEYQDLILEIYNNTKVNAKGLLYQYCMKHRLMKVIEAL